MSTEGPLKRTPPDAVLVKLDNQQNRSIRLYFANRQSRYRWGTAAAPAAKTSRISIDKKFDEQL